MNRASTVRLFIDRYFLTALLIIMFSPTAQSLEIDNTAIRYYINKADSVLNESIIFSEKLVFSVTAGSIYDKIDYRGLPDKSDTAKFLLEVQNEIIKTIEIIDSSELAENVFPNSLLFEKPWEQNCSFYFFPRDTGAGDLAIGFEPKSAAEIGVPSGMIILDRDSYIIRRIYLYYQTLDEYLWLSKTYQFSENNQVLLLKTLTIQGCFFGFFQRRYFRQDISFDDYSFH